MAEIIHEYFESETGDWGKPGKDYCTRCKGQVSLAYRFCPWCGERFSQKHTVVIIIPDGGDGDDGTQS